MRSKLHQSWFLLAVVVMLAGAAAPAPTLPVVPESQVLAHRAYYKMTLDSARNDSEVKAAEGLMMTEFQDACDGWIVQQKLDVLMTHEEVEDGVHLVTSYATWEAKDGSRYNFNYASTLNGEPHENFRGSASVSGPDRSGKASFVVPEARDVPLPAGTLFPTAHTFALIKAASARQPMFNATVFDGTDAKGMSEISAIIGAQQPVKLEQARQGLVGPAVAWPLRLAFFDVKGQYAEPEYEMDSNLLPNGVSEFMLLDYGKFRLRGTLEKIELFPKPDC